MDLENRWYWPTVMFTLGVGVLVSTFIPMMMAKRSGPHVFPQFIEESGRLASRNVTAAFWGLATIGALLLLIGAFMLISLLAT